MEIRIRASGKRRKKCNKNKSVQKCLSDYADRIRENNNILILKMGDMSACILDTL